MALKRPFHEENDGPELLVQESKRRPTFVTAIREVMRECSIQEFLSKIEPLLRNAPNLLIFEVREELERVILPYIHSSPRPSLNQIESSGSRGWQLHFIKKLPHTIFTGSRIVAEDNRPVQIVILDASSKNIITSGPLASIKIEIFVLDGDFGSDGQEDWTEKEFAASVVREREGKRPLATGNLVITLTDGLGYLGEITFTDNSSWRRSRKFRLGARAVQNTCSEERIREARSAAFIVKDHRGELYKKHHPPSFGDDVWRLERIGKDGAFHSRLADNGINTVQDFMRLFVTDPSLLRSILCTGMSNKTWETIIQHASACVLDDKLYMYYHATQMAGLLFNSIYNVVGATFDGQNCQPLNSLTSSQMLLVEGLKRLAYKNVKDIVEIDETLVSPSWLLPKLEAVSFPGSSLDMQYPDNPAPHQEFSEADEMATQLFLNQSTASPSYIVEDCGQLEEVAAMQGCQGKVFAPIQRNSFKMRYSCTVPYENYGNDWSPTGSLDPVMPGGQATDDKFQVQMPGWGQGSGLFLAPSDAGIGLFYSLPNLRVHISKSAKPNMGWFKLRAAIKWGISVRRAVAAKRLARLLQLDY
ncbi:hypothetical protein HHK36_026436 [Tetracentron sinense]|uniref:Calmodulin-binding protein n=1 Tax=Tetracentron sinense TaxID=13715 RepID=A0A835D2M9_TETSI|nr:hypothetical protein HHK36_026436 [Tetracentron sinense]